MPQEQHFFPTSIEDLSNYLADTFYPKGGFEANKLATVAQWILQRELEQTELVFMLEKFYIRIQENNNDGEET